MKKLLMIFLLVGITTATLAQNQEKQLTGKEKKEQKKQQKKALEDEMAQSLKTAIDSQEWVLEANYIANETGKMKSVQSNLNFVAITGDEVFLQLGSDIGLGNNGVGGASVRASTSKYEVTKNAKKGTYHIELYTSSSLGSFIIFLDSNATGKMVSGTLQDNTSNKVLFRGQLVPASKSRVYKGHAIN